MDNARSNADRQQSKQRKKNTLNMCAQNAKSFMQHNYYYICRMTAPRLRAAVRRSLAPIFRLYACVRACVHTVMLHFWIAEQTHARTHTHANLIELFVPQ